MHLTGKEDKSHMDKKSRMLKRTGPLCLKTEPGASMDVGICR